MSKNNRATDDQTHKMARPTTDEEVIQTLQEIDRFVESCAYTESLKETRDLLCRAHDLLTSTDRFAEPEKAVRVAHHFIQCSQAALQAVPQSDEKIELYELVSGLVNYANSNWGNPLAPKDNKKLIEDAEFEGETLGYVGSQLDRFEFGETVSFDDLKYQYGAYSSIQGRKYYVDEGDEESFKGKYIQQAFLKLDDTES